MKNVGVVGIDDPAELVEQKVAAWAADPRAQVIVKRSKERLAQASEKMHRSTREIPWRLLHQRMTI